MLQARQVRLRRLAEAYRRAVEVTRDTARARNAEILAAHDAGCSYGWIAREVGLRRHTVMEIVSNANIARQDARQDAGERTA